MDLPTHLVSGIAVGFVFFGRPEIALLVGLGTLIPDLDREYWFVGRQAYRDEQYHRALFHNVFIMALAYLVSPFLSLGLFIHVLQDSFTTVKDRGCEWFYPLTRLVKRGLYNADGHPQTLDPKERIYFHQEDPHGFLDYRELDLREEGPCPWRRVYGPALNSHLLDRGFLCGSIAIIFIWLFTPDGAHLALLLNHPVANYIGYIVGYTAIAIIFTAGELDRRDKPLKLPKLNFVKYPLFAGGLILFVKWLHLYRTEIITNLENILSNLISILLGGLLVFVICLAMIILQTRPSKTPAIV